MAANTIAQERIAVTKQPQREVDGVRFIGHITPTDNVTYKCSVRGREGYVTHEGERLRRPWHAYCAQGTLNGGRGGVRRFGSMEQAARALIAHLKTKKAELVKGN